MEIDETYDAVVMACRAVRPQDYDEARLKMWNDAIASGMPAPPTYPDSIHEPCEACEIPVQIGPRQQEKRQEIIAAGQEVAILCLIDAVIYTASAQTAGAAYNVQSLNNPNGIFD